MTERRKVKYASEMPIFEIAFAQKMTKTKKALKASDDQ
jgi:hypothetical protein